MSIAVAASRHDVADWTRLREAGHARELEPEPVGELEELELTIGGEAADGGCHSDLGLHGRLLFLFLGRIYRECEIAERARQRIRGQLLARKRLVALHGARRS